MKKIIDDLNNEHLQIDTLMRKLEEAVEGKNILTKLLEVENELTFFVEDHLKSHHLKEEKFLYSWMVDQNINSDKELIKKMIDDHNDFEERAKWILTELRMAKEEKCQSLTNLGYEVSEFVKNYQEHLMRESNFIFFIAEGLEKENAH